MFSMAEESEAISALLRVRKTWLGRSDHTISYFAGGRPGRSVWSVAAASRRARISAFSVSAVQVSLKRMLKAAVALAGMTLVAVLPTSIVVTSRFDGWKLSVPASKGGSSSASVSLMMLRTGLSARCG